MIQVVTLANCAEFDAFVCSHPNGHFMQCSAWGRCRPDWDWQGLMETDGRGQVRAAMALLSRRVSGTGLRLFYSPRGPVFERGRLVSLGSLLAAAQQLVKTQKGYLLRMDPQIPEGDMKLLRFFDSYGFKVDAIDDFSAFQPRFVYQIGLVRETDDLWRSLHHKTRYNIGLAERRGIQIIDAGIEGCAAFAHLLALTGERVGFRCRREEELMHVLVNYASHAHLWLALLAGEPVAGILCVSQGGKLWNLYSASSAEGQRNRANELLQWHAVCRAKAWGCSLYDLRGVEGLPEPDNPGYGLHRFKQHLGAELVCYAGQMDWVCRPVGYQMIRMAQKYCKR